AIVAADSLKASEREPSWQLRTGFRTRDRLSAIPFALDDQEILVGRFDSDPARIDDLEAEKAHAFLSSLPPAPGQTGHCEVDRERIFRLGIAGIRKELEALIAGEATTEQRNTWQSFLHALEGLRRFILNARNTVDQALTSADGQRRDELAELSQALTHITEHPPATFLEALQLVILIDLAIMLGDSVGLVCPGHLDRTLKPFYDRDMAAGRLSRERALELLEAYYILINDTVPYGLAIAVMVGGRDEHGDDVTNDLSYLCLEALKKTRLVYPTVGICRHEGTPQALMDLATEIIAEGCPLPAFFGDDTIQEGLQHYGLNAEESCNYINSTCVEISPVGSSNVWVASPYFSTCKHLLDEIEAQATDTVSEGFPAFLEAYKARLRTEIHRGAEEQNHMRELRLRNGGKPLQSVFTNDCISRGADIDKGGARFNWVECSFVGLANLADSLRVIETEVYEEKRLSLSELHNILEADFEGNEDVRIRFLNGNAKHGNDDPTVDRLLSEITTFCQKVCADISMQPDESHFIPGAFCWIMHERLGSQCGATPDGRRAGSPFADGAGPAQGREKHGPTAAVLSATSWDASRFIGGVAYNMKYNRSILRNQPSRNRLRDLVTTFLDRGGFETQINVVDYETLKAARANPEAHQDLVVRIGGYTDYFVRLSREMQEEVMMRTEFESI
ncbi:MAG: pyruvate formate lyase family protein, partial [Planctomycetota bacterium]